MSEMISFDDLANDTKFTFKDQIYVIPAITNEKAMELFKQGKAMKKDGSIDSPDLAKPEESEDNVSFQFEYISSAIVKENGEKVTPEEIKQWPMKVSLAVMKLINKCISGIDEDSPEEKKQ